MNYEEKAIEFVLNTFKKNTLKRLLIFGVPLLMLNIAFFIIAMKGLKESKTENAMEFKASNHAIKEVLILLKQE